MADNKTKRRKAKADRQAEEKRSPLGIARRSIWYILRVVLIISACITLCYLALVEAMYISNIYVIATEGMEMRADCILGNRGVLELREHFYEGWLQQDEELLETGKYSAFRVDSYDYRFDNIKKLRVYPWSTKATLQFTERVVNIQAVPYNDETTDPVPAWADSRMEIELEKIEGRWYITKLTVLEEMPEADPRPTPDYSQLETDIPHY